MKWLDELPLAIKILIWVFLGFCCLMLLSAVFASISHVSANPIDPILSMLPMLLLFAVLYAIWAAPIAIASYRSHPNTMAIAVLDILLGWTCIFWVLALVWSCTSAAQRGYYAER